MNKDAEIYCGLDGKSTDPVTVHAFNRWVARVYRYHLEPIRADLSSVRDDLAPIKATHDQVQQDVKLCREALYGTPDNPRMGLVNMREWICRSAVVTGGFIAAIVSAVPLIRWIGELFGWW